MPDARDVTVVAPEAWDALVETLPAASVYHTRAWLEAIAEEHALQLHLVRLDHDGRLEALWPCLSQRKGPLRIIGSPLPGWSTAYLGPLFAAEADIPAALETLLRRRPLRRWSFFACRTLDEHRPVPMDDFGFQRVEDQETFLLDLAKSENELWEGMEGRARTAIRKARKGGVEIRAETGTEFVDDFWGMSMETFARSRLQPNFSRSLAGRIVERFATEDRLCALSAVLGGERVGAVVLPCNHTTMYYWGGASREAGRKSGANNLLLWEGILDAQRRGLRWFDLVSNRGAPGRFKESFGPETHRVSTQWERSRSALVARLKSMYQARGWKKRRVRA